MKAEDYYHIGGRHNAARVLETHEAIRKANQSGIELEPDSVLASAQFAIAFAILDLSDAIRDSEENA